jgi:hypothetical protein
MSTFQPSRPFFDERTLSLPTAEDLMTSTERMAYRKTQLDHPSVDAETQALAKTFGPFATGLISSFAGTATAAANLFVERYTSDDPAYTTPLNYEPKPQRERELAMPGMGIDPMSIGHDYLPSMQNNLEGLTEDIMMVRPEERPWLMSSGSYGEFKDRLDRIRMASPEFAAQGSTGGKTVGFVADTASVILLGLAAEPVAMSGLHAMFIQNGTRIGQLATTARFGSLTLIAQDAAEAASALSRLSGIGRYAALGVAEEFAIKTSKYIVDPSFHPDTQHIAFDFALAAGLGGSIGSFAGRAYATGQIQRYANRYLHQAAIGGNTHLTMHSPFAFVSTAAADNTLLGGVNQPVGQAVDNIADAAFATHSRTGLEFAPGTQEIPLTGNVLQDAGTINRSEDVGASLIEGVYRPAGTSPTSFTPGNSDFIGTVLNGGSGLPKARRGQSLRPQPESVVLSNRRSSGNASDLTQNRLREGGSPSTGIEIEFASDNLHGTTVNNTAAGAVRSATGEVAFQYGGNWRTLRDSMRSVTVTVEASAAEAENVRGMLGSRGWNAKKLADGSVVYTPPGAARFTRPGAGFSTAVTGLQSSILNIVAEITRRGGVVNQDTARMIGRALYAAHQDKLTAGSFENRVWGLVSGFLDEGVAQRIAAARKAGNVVPVKQLTTEFDELVNRTEHIDGLWEHFNNAVSSSNLANPSQSSLILQVANEVRRRGGDVTREQFGQIIDDLHQLMTNPPRRINARGATTLRSQERLNRVAEIINSRVPEAGRRVHVSTSLRNSVREFANHLEVTRNGQRLAEDARLAGGAPAVPVAPSALPQELEALEAAAEAEAAAAAGGVVPPAGGGGAAPPAAGGLGGGGGGGSGAGSGGAGGGGAGGGGAVPPAGGGAGAVPPAAATPATTNSLTGATLMNAETPQLDRYDTLGVFQRFFNQAAVVLRVNNPAARMAMLLAFNARRAMATPGGQNVAQARTVFEHTTYEMTGHIAQGVTSWRNGYVRYALNRGQGEAISFMDGVRTGFGRGARARIDEFNTAVVEQLRTGAFNHANDGVNAAARDMRRVLQEIHNTAATAGVAGFENGAIVDYLPRLWRWDRIARLGSTPAGRQSLISLLETALNVNGGTRQIIVNGVATDLPDIPQAAVVLANRLINLSQHADLAPVLDIDVQLSQALQTLLAPLAGAGASRTPFGRARIIMNETADLVTAVDHLNTGRNGIGIADLTMNDIPSILQRYSTSVYGAIGERRLLTGFNEQLAHFRILDNLGNPVQVNSVDEMYSTINHIGNMSATFGGSMDVQTMDSLKEVIAAIRYEPLHRSTGAHGPLGRWGENFHRVALPLGYMSSGGAFALSALSETSRIVGTLGLRSTIAQMPIILEMVGNARRMDEGANNFAGMIADIMHPSTDRLRRVLMQGVQNQYGHEAGAFTRGLARTANAFSDISLLTPITSFTQTLMAAGTIQHFYDVSRGLVRAMDDATVRTLGLEPAQYQDVVAYIGANAVTAARRGGERVINLNNIHDIRMDNLRSFIDRAVRTRIQDMPTRGDFARGAFGFWGRMLTQFRAFNLKGVDNFLLQNVSRVRRGDTNTRMRVTQELGATILLSALIQYSRSYADAQSLRASGNRKKAAELEKNMLGVEGFVRGGLVGPSELFGPLIITDSLYTSAFSDDPLFSAYRYSGASMYGFPVQSFITKGAGVVKDVYGATAAKAFGIEDKEREITTGTVHKMRTMLPFQTFLPLKHFFNISEKAIADEYQLLDKQERGTSRRD